MELFEHEVKQVNSIVPMQQTDLIKSRKFSVTNLSGQTLYNFCPFCVKEMKKKSFAHIPGQLLLKCQQDLDPLQVVTNKCLYKYSNNNEQGIVLFEKHYNCKKCNKEVKIEDFINTYAEPATFQKYSKLIDLSDQEALDKF